MAPSASRVVTLDVPSRLGFEAQAVGILRRERIFRLGTQYLVVYGPATGAGSSAALTR